MDKKQKQTIGISLMGIGAVGVVSVFGYWYFKQLKKQAKIDELEAEGEADMGETLYDPQRSRFNVYDKKKVSDRFKISVRQGEEKVGVREKGRLRASGRSPSGYDRKKERFRVSGNTRRTDTPSEYNNKYPELR